jgi:hypothetical protein
LEWGRAASTRLRPREQKVRAGDENEIDLADGNRAVAGRSHLVLARRQRARERDIATGTRCCIGGRAAKGALPAGALIGAARLSEVSIDVACRVAAITASRMVKVTKTVARIAVDRVRKSAAPRADINPAGLPPPVRPPPSERCIRMMVTSAAPTSN